MWLVTLVLYRTMWWPPPGRPPQWLGWDCFETYWPDLSYYASSIRHGEWPLWNPYDRGGYPFYSDPQPGLYYPVNWLFVIPGAIAGGMPLWAMELKALLHHVLMGSLMYAFLRTRGLPRVASALAGAALILSAPFIIHKASAQLWPMVWAPLVWICIDRMVARAREPGWWRRSAALAGAIFLSGASGPPPGFFYILLMSVAYGALRLAQALRAARAEGGRERFAEEARVQGRALSLAAGVAVALLVVVVLPGLTMADESATRGATRNLTYALNTALPPAPTLKGLVAPWAGLVDAYWGVAMVVLAIVALVTRPRADRDAPWLFTGVAFVALVLAFGGATPVLPFLVKHVPGFGLFREPNRYKIAAAIALAVVAAHGVAALVDEDRARRRRALVTLAATVGGLAALMLLFRALGAAAKPGAPGIGLSLALLVLGGALLAGLAFTPARFRGVLVAATLVLIGWDTSSFASGFLAAREAPVDDQEDRRWLAGLGDVAREWRVYDEYVMEQRPGARLRVRDFRGYPSGDPFDDLRYSEARARFKQSPELVAAFNIGWVLHGAHHRNGTSKNFIVQPPDRTAPTRFRKLDEKRFEVVDPAPLVAWYGAAQVVTTRAQALDALVAEERASGLRTRAVVEQADVPAALAEPIAALAAAPEATPASVAGRLLAYDANEIRVAVDAPARGVVVLNEKMLPGWEATIDGQAAPVFRANFLLRAVVVPPGAHTIVWTYHPPRYAFFLLLWLAGAASILAAGGSAWRARRSNAPAAIRG
jgi:hypothetical protein